MTVFTVRSPYAAKNVWVQSVFPIDEQYKAIRVDGIEDSNVCLMYLVYRLPRSVQMQSTGVCLYTGIEPLTRGHLS